MYKIEGGQVIISDLKSAVTPMSDFPHPNRGYCATNTLKRGELRALLTLSRCEFLHFWRCLDVPTIINSALMCLTEGVITSKL